MPTKIIYKQRHRDPCRKGRPYNTTANAEHLKYIGTREGVLPTDETASHLKYIGQRPGTLETENAANGLFGYINGKFAPSTEMTAAQGYIRNISKQHDIFRCCFSFTPDSAAEAGLHALADWQRFVSASMNKIAKYMEMKIENIEWYAAVHLKEGQLHVHIMYWDKEQKIRRNKPYLQYRIGRMFYDGYGTKTDMETALKWLEQAASGSMDAAKAEAQSRHGCRQSSFGTGNHNAQYTVGKMYRDGTGTAPNMEKASLYISRAAESGNVYAKAALARLYLRSDEHSRHYQAEIILNQLIKQSTGEQKSYFEAKLCQCKAENRSCRRTGQDRYYLDRNYGVCLYFDLQSYIYAGVVWDSEDYILELSGDLTKKELIDLAKTAKVFKD